MTPAPPATPIAYRRQALAGGFLFATPAIFARSLPFRPEQSIASLHRPLRGTPRCALWLRNACAEESPYFGNGFLGVRRLRPEGFTLLELIVVLVLAGLVAAIAAPSFTGSLESARLRSGAAEVRAAMTLARTLAASGSRVRALVVDIDKGEYAVEGEGRTFRLPDGIRIDTGRVSGRVAEQGTFRVRFFPDGSAEETRIVVASRGGGRLRVSVDPLTGIAEAGI